MRLSEAASVIEKLLGQRPADEAPPRSPEIIVEALAIMGGTNTEYFQCRAKAGWMIPRLRPEETDKSFALRLRDELLYDEAAWRIGVEAGLNLSVPAAIGVSMCAELARALRLFHEVPPGTMIISPEEVQRGKSYCIWDIECRYLVYAEVVGLGEDEEGVGLRGNKDALIRHSTIARSGWALGEQSVDRIRRRVRADNASVDHDFRPQGIRKKV